MSYTEHPTKNKKLPASWAGPRWWQVVWYPEGKKGGKETLLFYGTKIEAQAYDLEKKRELRKEPLQASPQFSRLIPDFVEHYRTDHMPRSVDSLLWHLRHLEPVFGKYPLRNITAEMIEEYKRLKLAEGLKPITINKHLNNLSSILKYAYEKNLIGEVARIKLFPGKMTKSPIPILPTAEDFERILAEVKPSIRGIHMAEFYGGLRRAEAHRLQAENWVSSRKLLVITGKGGKQRIVPVTHPALITELDRRSEEVKTGYLWVNPVTGRPYVNTIEALKGAAKRAGVDLRVYHHLLRHGFGTTAIEDGVDLSSVSKVMGHSTTKTTEIYTHLAATHIISQMGKFRQGIPAPQKDYLSKEEVAEWLDVSVRTIQRMIIRGELLESVHFERVGREPRFFPLEIDRLAKNLDTISKK